MQHHPIDQADTREVPAEALAEHHRAVHRSKTARERGVAVFLALIAVCIALLIGLAIASTRDANTATGGGIVLATQARAASAGAMDIADHIGRRYTPSLAGDPTQGPRELFLPKRVGSTMLSAVVRDANTRMGPSEETVGMEIEASSTVNGTTHPMTGVRRVEWQDTTSRADLDLSEFAIFSAGITVRGGSTPVESIEIGPGSEVSVWRGAPLAKLGEQLVIGTKTRSSSAINISPDAIALGHAVLKPGKFPASESERKNQISLGERTINSDVVVPAAPRQAMPATAQRVNYTNPEELVWMINEAPPPVATQGPTAQPVVATVPNMRIRVARPIRELKLEFKGPVAAGAWRVVAFEGELALSKCSWRFEVPTMLVTSGNLRMVDSEFLVGPNGALAIVSGSGAVLSNSVIGPKLPSGTRENEFDPRGGALYADVGASSVMLYAQRAVTMAANAVIKGQIYAPAAPVRLFDGSAVYGRILGGRVSLDQSNLFYDPELNSGRGWLSPASGIWSRPDEVRAEVAEIRMLNDQELSNFSRKARIAVDPPETRIFATANVADAGGSGVTTRNEADSGDSADGNLTADGSAQGARTALPNAFVILDGTLRDFRESSESGGHPDFENPSFPAGLRYGLVRQTLGSDGKPVLATTTAQEVTSSTRNASGNNISWTAFDPSLGDTPAILASAARQAISSEASFNSWFRDTPGVNLSEPFRVTLRRVTDSTGRQTYVFDSRAAAPYGPADGTGPNLDGFFPLEGRLFGNSAVRPVMVGRTPLLRDRNFHFTLEFSTAFTYEAGAGQTFVLQSTDDAWAFIDGRLAIDLGGTHGMLAQLVELDRFGLSSGRTYSIKIFYANRRRPDSHLRFATNFPIAAPLPQPPAASPLVFLQQLADRRATVRADFFRSRSGSE